jgi:hypothetical protein
MSEEKRVSFVAGPAGWVEVTWPGGTAYAHFQLNDDRKTWRIDELRFPDPTASMVRSFPLNRIETAANAAIGSLGLAIGRGQVPPKDLAAWFDRARTRQAKSAAAGRYVLERPEGRRLEDGFYALVAHAYRGATGAGLDPRQTLARDSGAAPDTVARWIGEARRRGFLPPTTAGKITAHG